MGEEGLWCPIFQQYCRPDSVKAAHIVPYSIGEYNCQYLFGNDEAGKEHFFDDGNGLLLHKDLEAVLDNAQIAIVPKDTDNTSADELVVVLDPAILKRKGSYGSPPWGDLAGRPLLFRRSQRPRLRYLYFKFLMNLMRRRRYECQGWKNDLFKYATGAMWGSPG